MKKKILQVPVIEKAQASFSLRRTSNLSTSPPIYKIENR